VRGEQRRRGHADRASANDNDISHGFLSEKGGERGGKGGMSAADEKSERPVEFAGPRAANCHVEWRIALTSARLPNPASPEYRDSAISIWEE
jgi:hypothetical protein